MAGTSVGPVNIQIRADATMIGQDMAKVEKQISLKGSLMRINPALKGLGLGIDKGFMKQIMREAPSMLGAAGLGAVSGALGGAAGLLGPVGLALGLGEKAWHKILDLAGAADPAALKAYHAVFDDMSAIIGRMFVPALKDATEALRGWANILNFAIPGGKGNNIGPGMGGLSDQLLKQGGVGGFLGGAMKAFQGIGSLGKMLPDSTGIAKEAEAQKANLGTIESFSDKMTTAAFEAEGGTTPAQQTAENTGGMLEALRVIVAHKLNERGIRGF